MTRGLCAGGWAGPSPYAVFGGRFATGEARPVHARARRALSLSLSHRFEKNLRRIYGGARPLEHQVRPPGGLRLGHQKGPRRQEESSLPPRRSRSNAWNGERERYLAIPNDSNEQTLNKTKRLVPILTLTR